jgi:hypothetical protein
MHRGRTQAHENALGLTVRSRERQRAGDLRTIPTGRPVAAPRLCSGQGKTEPGITLRRKAQRDFLSIQTKVFGSASSKTAGYKGPEPGARAKKLHILALAPGNGSGK